MPSFTLPSTIPTTDAELQALGDRIFDIAFNGLRWKQRCGRTPYSFVFCTRLTTRGGDIWTHATRTASTGRPARTRNRVRINPALTIDHMVEVLIHELAHGMANAEFGPRTKHTEPWHRVNNAALKAFHAALSAEDSARITAEASTTHSYLELMVKRKARKRYEYVCTNPMHRHSTTGTKGMDKRYSCGQCHKAGFGYIPYVLADLSDVDKLAAVAKSYTGVSDISKTIFLLPEDSPNEDEPVALAHIKADPVLSAKYVLSDDPTDYASIIAVRVNGNHACNLCSYEGESGWEVTFESSYQDDATFDELADAVAHAKRELRLFHPRQADILAKHLDAAAASLTAE